MSRNPTSKEVTKQAVLAELERLRQGRHARYQTLVGRFARCPELQQVAALCAAAVEASARPSPRAWRLKIVRDFADSQESHLGSIPTLTVSEKTECRGREAVADHMSVENILAICITQSENRETSSVSLHWLEAPVSEAGRTAPTEKSIRKGKDEDNEYSHIEQES